MKHLPTTLFLGSVLAIAPAYVQAQLPGRTQQSAAVRTPAPASTTATPAAESDDVFERARRLMAAGQEESGRALVQSELNSAEPGSARYVEALYWRAVLAKTAADAERDLRTIVIDYPLAEQSDDALMRLAQLEMTRGDEDQAMGHLQRVVREHPRSVSRSRASFWMARMLFDKGDSTGACARLADAVATTPPGEVELRNQIDYLSPRCVGVDTNSTPGVARPQPPAAQPPAARPQPGKPPAVGPRAGNPPVAQQPDASTPPPQEFTVQVAALSSHESAERIRQRLTDLGYAARITGGEAPYRVRVGRYPTRVAADSVAARMKSQHVDGYVTGAEPRR